MNWGTSILECVHQNLPSGRTASHSEKSQSMASESYISYKEKKLKNTE